MTVVTPGEGGREEGREGGWGEEMAGLLLMETLHITNCLAALFVCVLTSRSLHL